MSEPPPVYMDFAATAAIRPDTVVEAVARYLRDTGATPGRSGHRLAVKAGRVALRCRRVLAELLGIPGDPGRITFQANATQALNTALFGLLRSGDRVVRTRYDHNSVRRPTAALRARGVEVSVLSGDSSGRVDLDEAARLLAGEEPSLHGQAARLLVIPHASNVLDLVLPVAELAERAHAAGALVLVDAAQTAGHLPFSTGELGIDLLAFTGHKGLLAPQGTGGLWVRDGIDVEPLLFGGAGGDSWSEEMPAAFPDRLEAGTQNGSGIAGLLAGAEWLLEKGVAEVHSSTARLKRRFIQRVEAIHGVTVLSSPSADGVGIITLIVAGTHPAELARRLDAEHGVMTRAGLHCAPETHELLGTSRLGAVRFSFGWSTTEAEVDRAVAALASLAGNAAAGSAVPNPEPTFPDEPVDGDPPRSEQGSHGTW